MGEREAIIESCATAMFEETVHSKGSFRRASKTIKRGCRARVRMVLAELAHHAPNVIVHDWLELLAATPEPAAGRAELARREGQGG